MKRLPARICALVITVLLPSVAFAQKEPPHTKETKDAEKFIGLALTRQDPAQKKQYLEQALPALRQAMQKNPENGRVWALAVSVLAGLGQFPAADSAWDKAVELHVGYTDQIDNERHVAWESAFNEAVELINQQKTDEGITALERAELMYPHRPEAKFYLGVFYSQKDELDKAEQEYLKVADEARFGFEKREALERAAVLRAQRGDAAGAIELYNRAIETLPDDSPDRPIYEMRIAELRGGTPVQS